MIFLTDSDNFSHVIMCMENVKRAQHKHDTKIISGKISKNAHTNRFIILPKRIYSSRMRSTYYSIAKMKTNFYMIISSSLHISFLACINTTHIQYSVTPLKITSLNSFFVFSSFFCFSLSLVDSPLSFLDYVSGALGRIQRVMLNSLSFPHTNIMHQHIFQTVYLTVDDCRRLLDSFFVYSSIPQVNCLPSQQLQPHSTVH